MPHFTTVPRRITSSEAIEGEGKMVVIAAIVVRGLASDSVVTIYDAQDNALETKEVYEVGLQPGGNGKLETPMRLHDGGYVNISGTAKVFLYLK